MNIILCGFMGCGKTTVGKQVAKKLGMKFIDTDEYIENNENMKINQIFSKYGENYFRELEFQACTKLADENNVVISTGGGAMTFQRNANAFKNKGAVVLIDVPFSVINERIGSCHNRPLFNDINKAKELYEIRINLYKNYADIIVNGNNTITKVTDSIIDKLKFI